MDKVSDKQRDPQTYAVIGAAMEVHGCLGFGFLENVYQCAMECELGLQGIDYKRQVNLPLSYKGRPLECSYKADLICYDEIIVELKACGDILDSHVSQLLNYLKVTGLRRGLLINFGKKKLEYKRLVMD
jgi:GxxExxY protein